MVFVVAAIGLGSFDFSILDLLQAKKDKIITTVVVKIDFFIFLNFYILLQFSWNNWQ